MMVHKKLQQLYGTSMPPSHAKHLSEALKEYKDTTPHYSHDSTHGFDSLVEWRKAVENDEFLNELLAEGPVHVLKVRFKAPEEAPDRGFVSFEIRPKTGRNTLLFKWSETKEGSDDRVKTQSSSVGWFSRPLEKFDTRDRMYYPRSVESMWMPIVIPKYYEALGKLLEQIGSATEERKAQSEKSRQREAQKPRLIPRSEIRG